MSAYVSTRAWLSVLALCLPCAAVGQTAPPYPPAVVKLIADARAQVTMISIASFKSMLEAREEGLLIDVREPSEYASGHVPSAINIPRGLIETRIWPHVGFPDKTDLNRKITLYCSTGVRNVLSAKSLQELGFSNVVAVDMRMEDWVKAGNAVTKD